MAFKRTAPVSFFAKLPHPDGEGRATESDRVIYRASADRVLAALRGADPRLRSIDYEEDTDELGDHLLWVEVVDRAVLTAYGWADLLASPGVPPYTTPRTPVEQRAFAAFEDVVIDRLFALNATRAAAETLAAAPAATGKKVRGPKASAKRGAKAAADQLSLTPSDDD